MNMAYIHGLHTDNLFLGASYFFNQEGLSTASWLSAHGQVQYFLLVVHSSKEVSGFLWCLRCQQQVFV